MIEKKIKEIQQIIWPVSPHIWIDPQQFNKLPWKIGAIQGNLYEYGLPHTRSDVIIIPRDQIQDTDDFKITLIHEKLHIYQKTLDQDFKLHLEKNGWKKHQPYQTCPRCRSNPDTDEYIYTQNNKIHQAIYTQNPQSIMDVTYFPKNFFHYEHPYEKLVLDLLKEIKKKPL